MKVSEYIVFTIDRLPKGYIFTYSDFNTEVTQKEAVIKALNRMVASGKIAKLSKGKYYKPENTPFGNLQPNQVSYEGINRVETYECPKDAVREALLNAIAHKDYSGGVPIQISVYTDKIIIWNEGQLPENWTVKNLLEKHASRPDNPDIANALFRSGYIESWGRGTLKIIRECKQAGIPEPVFSYDSSDISVEFRKDIYNEKYLQSLNLNDRQVKAVLFTKEKGKLTNSDYFLLFNRGTHNPITK